MSDGDSNALENSLNYGKNSGDNALSRKECDKIIADFEISSADHFGGNVMVVVLINICLYIYSLTRFLLM